MAEDLLKEILDPIDTSLFLKESNKDDEDNDEATVPPLPETEFGDFDFLLDAVDWL